MLKQKVRSRASLIWLGLLTALRAGLTTLQDLCSSSLTRVPQMSAGCSTISGVCVCTSLLLLLFPVLLLAFVPFTDVVPGFLLTGVESHRWLQTVHDDKMMHNISDKVDQMI